MDNQYFISIIIPMYNAEQTIEKCLESVLYQLPYDQIEVIVVNDGSKDNSFFVVQKYIENHPARAIKLISQENRGVSAARNTGIKASIGNYIALIDSDDIWLEGKLKHQIEIFESTNADFVGALHNNLKLGFPYSLKGDLYEATFGKIILRMAPSTITAVFRKSLIEKAGYYDENQKYSEDLNLWLRFSKCGKMIIINKNYAVAGDYKPLFGFSGLSGNLKGMFDGEKKNLIDMLYLKYIRLYQYILLRLFITLKYWRRVIISKTYLI